MKYFLLLSFLASVSFAQADTTINLVHYNIRELDVSKIRAGTRNEQVKQASRILKKFPADIVSINEIHYDLPGIPNADFKTKGKNIKSLGRLFLRNYRKFRFSFHESNMGENAKKKPDGTYELNPRAPGARKLTDPVNFGIFPGQYSTGAITKYKVLNRKVLSSLRWKSFRPSLDVSPYRDLVGNKFNVKTLELFNNDFTDWTVLIDGQKVHLIFLHTIPAFNFGDPKSINELRNADQISFLEWYLSGSTGFAVPSNLNENGKAIQPLPPGSSFIAMGDWNVDITDTAKPGALILKRLLQKFTPVLGMGRTLTYESGTYAPKPYSAQLDYVLVSKNIDVVRAQVYAPDPARKELGCGLAKIPSPTNSRRVVKSYKNSQAETQKCWVEVSLAYAQAKTASDHFPVVARLKLRRNSAQKIK